VNADEMTEKEIYDLHKIAWDVVHGKQNLFLVDSANAYLRAGKENEKILRPAWLKMIEKYNLKAKEHENE